MRHCSVIVRRIGGVVWRSSRSNSSTTTDSSSRNLKRELLDRALSHVASLGWSDVALAQAATDLGLTPMSSTMISRGAVELVEHFLGKKREQVSKTMSELLSTPPPGPPLTQSEILYHAVETHINFIQPIRQTWPAALALLVAPQNIPYTLVHMEEMTGDLCDFLDIRAARIDWYTERGLLSAVYCSTELYLLTDSSADLEETRDFLRRNIEVYNSARKGDALAAFSLASVMAKGWR
jgi:ubiquinone biosynthesis protein COQ9